MSLSLDDGGGGGKDVDIAIALSSALRSIRIAGAECLRLREATTAEWIAMQGVGISEDDPWNDGGSGANVTEVLRRAFMNLDTTSSSYRRAGLISTVDLTSSPRVICQEYLLCLRTILMTYCWYGLRVLSNDYDRLR